MIMMMHHRDNVYVDFSYKVELENKPTSRLNLSAEKL